MTKKYYELMEKYPVDESISNMLVPGAVALTVNGYEAITVSEVKPEKLEKALERINRSMVMLHSIPDFRYEVQVRMTFDECLKSIGMG